jgi:hypothetical protein
MDSGIAVCGEAPLLKNADQGFSALFQLRLENSENRSKAEEMRSVRESFIAPGKSVLREMPKVCYIMKKGEDFKSHCTLFFLSFS